MQSFIVDQVLILIQSLKNSTLEKSPSDISYEVKRLKEFNDILRQQNGSLLEESSWKNTIIQLLIKNQEYLNKLVCHRKTVLDETSRMVPKGPFKQGSNTETSRINYSNGFQVLSKTDDDNDNDNKSGKSDNTIIEDFLTNCDVRNWKKIQKSCITNKNYKNNSLPKKIETYDNRSENKQIRSSRNITKTD